MICDKCGATISDGQKYFYVANKHKEPGKYHTECEECILF